MLPRVYDTSGMVPAPAPSTHEKGAVRAKTVEYGRVALRAAVHFAVRVYITVSPLHGSLGYPLIQQPGLLRVDHTIIVVTAVVIAAFCPRQSQELCAYHTRKRQDQPLLLL